MDFSSLRKSFNKSHGSYKHMRKLSADGGGIGEPVDYEGQPILLDHENNNNHSMRSIDSPDRKEFIVKVDGGDNSRDSNGAGVGNANASKIWRESSYEFWRDDGSNSNNGGESFVFPQRGGGGGGMEDPPSKLIGQFLSKQKSSGEVSLDMDLEMDELRHDRNSKLPTVPENSGDNRSVFMSKELKVSFQPPDTNVVENGPDSNGRKYKESSDEEEYQQFQRHKQDQQYRKSSNLAGGGDGGDGEVLKCTSNSNFQRKSSLLRTKTKSRLMDPPDQPDRKSGRIGKSGQLRSGLLAKAMDDEDDDPFLEGDIPEDYKKSKFSIWTLLEWVSLILIVGTFVCSLAIPSWKSKKFWSLKLWKWEVLVLVLICGRLVSGWGIRFAVFFIERNFLLRKRVLYFVYGLKKAVQNCLWLGLVLIAWHFLFDKKMEKEIPNTKALQYVTKILICLLVGTLLWLFKTLMVKVLASSFHVSTYFDRIQESLFNQYVIETLSGLPLIEIEHTFEEEERIEAEVQKLQNAGATVPPDLRATAFSSTKSGRVIGSGVLPPKPLNGKSIRFSRALSKNQDEGITIDHLHKLNPKNISAWNMKRLMNIIRHGTLSTLDEQIVDTSQGDESATQIRSEYEAKAAARKIFNNVAKPGSRYIYLEDIMRFMREDEAVKTLSLFEGASESKRISKSSLKNWVVHAFRERRALALTLNDTKTAVNKLHQMVNVIVGILIGVIWLIILGIATSKFILFVSSQLVVATFIFGNTLKTIFEALIFLFVIHPFDVGDRCEIDAVQMVVEEMNILTTVFLRYDNQKIVYLNSVLATKSIANYYRSPDMGDSVEFLVHIATPTEKIALMKQRISNYMENKKEHWYPSPMIIMKELEGINQLRFAVWMTHRMNHQNMGEKWIRRTQLVEEMVKIFKELDIEYRLYPTDINIRSMPPVTSTRMPSN